MLVNAVAAEGFRNLEPLALPLHPRFNVFHGGNGQGKTNLLEAIYLLATLRSFRTNRLEELVRFGAAAAILRARVEHRQIERHFAVEIGLRPTRKLALCDGKAARTSEYFGGFNVVLFAPEDLRLLKGPPAGRRRFLDRAIWNTFPGYLDEVRVYERILRHRNALLRQGQSAEVEDLLQVYEKRLADAGAQLVIRRRRYIAALSPKVTSAFAAICGDGLQMELHYTPALRARPETKAEAIAEIAAGTDIEAAPIGDELGICSNELLFSLKRDRRRDFLRGFTHSGPHADDWSIDLSHRPAEEHASQGQMRALILALKIAEIQHLGGLLGDHPVLLLDDVSSELDAEKNAALFAFLRGPDCQAAQVFITTTSPAHIQVPLGVDRKDFTVTGGIIAG